MDQTLLKQARTELAAGIFQAVAKVEEKQEDGGCSRKSKSVYKEELKCLSYSAAEVSGDRDYSGEIAEKG